MKPAAALLLLLGILAACAPAPDSRGGDPGPCPLAESLKREGTYMCRTRRACRLRSDMFIDCNSEGQCTCNKDDGTLVVFVGSCTSLEEADDACGDGS